MGALAAILSFMTSAAGPLFTWLTSRDNAKRDEAITQINAWIASVQTITQFKATQFGWWGTRVLFFFAAIGPIYHELMIYLDSCGTILWYSHVVGSWNIEKPPEPFATMEQTIIMSFFATTVVGSGLKTVQQAMLLKHDREMAKMGIGHDLQSMNSPNHLQVKTMLNAARPMTVMPTRSIPPLVWIILGLILIGVVVVLIAHFA